MIAHFGTGLMAASFVRAALERGDDVAVWNRSPDKATALEPSGARAVSDPAQAARGAMPIRMVLADDDSVDAVLEPLAGVLGPRARIIDHTTTAQTPTAQRYARWKQRGIFFAHVPMFMGPRNAPGRTGLMLVSGPAERVAVVRPINNGKNMAERHYALAWELAKARKDVGPMLEEGARQGVAYDIHPQIATFSDRVIAAGHGTQDVGVVAAH